MTFVKEDLGMLWFEDDQLICRGEEGTDHHHEFTHLETFIDLDRRRLFHLPRAASRCIYKLGVSRTRTIFQENGESWEVNVLAEEDPKRA